MERPFRVLATLEATRAPDCPMRMAAIKKKLDKPVATPVDQAG